MANDAQRRVRRALEGRDGRGGEFSSAQLREATGLNSVQLSNALQQLRIHAIAEQVRKGVWRLTAPPADTKPASGTDRALEALYRDLTRITEPLNPKSREPAEIHLVLAREHLGRAIELATEAEDGMAA